ncbi:dUTP diphosphatase [Lyticum sinuosum]|uniref:Deoxyuridine 5'-triphosphate nucleotidohydrolase n=1 Tax=Lyticum sinuosum TaxID=1332059 RepID=A0AAE4VK03_9RICK|nr:dUTP diphosphatase [Lyticum sinuosum]MDZ5761380.1 Deoxyuridine 5'-triphosphate nucleotidohydrolase [Lyticum sinuosum]
MNNVKVPLLDIKIKFLPHAVDLPIPQYATAGSAGLDIMSAIPNKEIIIYPGERSLIETGICIAIPDGYEGQIRSRSGLSLKNGIIVLNSPGTIDSDYRGEIKIILANFGNHIFTITHGMRIAQLVINRYERVCLAKSEELNTSIRCENGFGSTGL